MARLLTQVLLLHVGLGLIVAVLAIGALILDAKIRNSDIHLLDGPVFVQKKAVSS